MCVELYDGDIQIKLLLLVSPLENDAVIKYSVSSILRDLDTKFLMVVK